MTPELASVSSATTPESIQSLETKAATEGEARMGQLQRKTTPEVPFKSCEFQVECKDEAALAALLDEVHSKFENVSIGSYPQEGGDSVVLSLESKDRSALMEASTSLREKIVGENQVILREDSLLD